MSLAPDAVYTILHPEWLDEIAKSAQPARLRETKRWVTAKVLFDEARERGEEMAILFADAANDCSKLLYWSKLCTLEVDETGTSYTMTELRPLRGRRTQELVLRSTNKMIAEGYLRPYAVVRTPSFINEHETDARKPATHETKAAHPASRAPLPTTPAKRPTASAALPTPLPAPRVLERTNTGITLFSFGYWGSGSATPALVNAVGAAEALRGFEPPLWVDIRISRSVRAAGFRDHAFENLLGPQYLWMPDLGNVAVQEHRGGIDIKDPAAAEQLLEHALSRQSRRVIFFCACETPAECHRHVVAKLVVKRAKARGLDVTVIEWPGGEPSQIDIDVPAATIRSVARGGQTSLPLPQSMTVGAATALAWGTMATLHAGAESTTILVGPAHFDGRGSHLKILAVDSASNASAQKFRAKNGYTPISARSD
jgi:hypothetical protein